MSGSMVAEVDNSQEKIRHCCGHRQPASNGAFFKKLLVLLLCLCSTSPAFASERILALAPHICEILYAIGAGKDVVGAVSYCDYPEEAKSLPRVGSYNRINVEAALALAPTMAIVSDEKMIGVQKLRSLGVKIVQSHPEQVDDVLLDIRHIGSAVGQRKRANQLADSLQKRLDKLDASMENLKTAVFYEIWPTPLLTAGKHTFINNVLQRIGLRNVFGDVELEAPRVNVEAVIAAKPKIIIIPSEKRDVAKRIRFWKKWLGEDIRVISVNPDLVHRPGPRLLDGMEYLAGQLEGLQIEH
ncbi:MAG: helical backbone metal receptor [Mariprofundaceae bacterium]|nr:helical backbone metal receptor [Mariprofundaceae bacterium]